MSTTPTSTLSPTPATPLTNADRFTLHDASSRTEVVYEPKRGGPIPSGSSANGGSLAYKGVEGTFTFLDNQIVTESTAIGSLVSVTLNVVPDLRTLTFSLLMPQVDPKTPGSPQTFQTLAIKAAHHTSLTGTQPAGGNPTYQEMLMHGSADRILIPG